MLLTILGVGILGLLGSITRFGTNELALRFFGLPQFYGTLTVNTLGSLVIGFLYFSCLKYPPLTNQWRIMISAGFLGGLTTFSGFALDALLLIEDGKEMKAVVYIFLSLGMGLVACMTGAFCAKQIFG